jgi:signal transduction histidine kinase
MVRGYSMVAHEIPALAALPADGVPPDGTDPARQLTESRVLLAAERADRTQAEEARVRLLRRLIRTQEDERRRIARDLHDTLGQRLTALRLMLESLGHDRDHARFSTTLTSALGVLAGIDRDVDFIAWELRPTALDDVGIIKVVQAHVDEWSRHTNIRATFRCHPPGMERLAPDVEIVLYRIIQEALNNVAKHAAAQAVDIVLEQRDQEILLCVEDDGVGFTPRPGPATMIGLEGMREHALAMGGALSIGRGANGGTRVFANVPMASPPLELSERTGSVSASIRPAGPKLSTGEELSGDELDKLGARLQELQRAVSERDEFIATVAHELRNPIAPLTFQVRFALGKIEQVASTGTPPSTAWVQSQLRSVEQRLHRLLETLDRLLDVSRLTTGRIDLQLERMDLAETVREVVTTLDAELAVARCELTFATDGDTTGTWDRWRVEQICRNLMSNAMRFGAGRPIEVTVRGDDRFATLRVRDHGIGIPREQQARLFGRFEQGPGQRSGGFGIGLWVVKTTCIAMGGTVVVDSELGRGACFTVRLPRRQKRPRRALKRSQ